MIDIATNHTEPIAFTDKQQLIYNLLFDESQTVYYITLNDYCVYKERPRFREEIRNVLKRGSVQLLDDRIIHDDDTVFWKLTIKHL